MPDLPRHRLAACQFNPRLGDLHANLQHHLELGEQAARQGCDLALFPELSLCGYALKDQVHEVALALDDTLLDPLLELSRQIDLCVGFVERSPAFLYYNSMAYLAGGRLLHVQRKVYLPTYGLLEEKRFFAPGESVRAFDTRLGRIGLLVCNDWWHAGLPTVLCQEGATLLLAPANSPSRALTARAAEFGFGPGIRVDNENARVWYSLLAFHAKTQSCPVLFCNRTGFDDGLGFWGGSSWWGPDGICQQALGAEEGLLTVEHDLDAVRRERVYSPLLRDEELDLQIRELTRVRALRNGNAL
jgi:predicted amidohydrolase